MIPTRTNRSCNATIAIVLVSQDFDVQITTTALWLNDVQGMDIRCIRMTPYLLGDRLLLDVQQVIPLPEAEQFTVKLRRREAAVKAAKASSKDYTKFIVGSPEGQTEPLNKRNAALAAVKAAIAAGAPSASIAKGSPEAASSCARACLTPTQSWTRCGRRTRTSTSTASSSTIRSTQMARRGWCQDVGTCDRYILTCLTALVPSGSVSVTAVS